MADVEGLNKTNEWYNTGDLIEFKGENKFVIIGRKNNLINVGGYKVNPHEIETLVRTFNIVQDIRVYSRPNKITGNIPVAELVIDSNQNKRLLKKRLIKLLRDNLQDWKIPKMFYFVKELDQTKTGKLLRK